VRRILIQPGMFYAGGLATSNEEDKVKRSPRLIALSIVQLDPKR
jgi:hypothetical protein